MAERIRAHDWAATPLGPIEGWHDRLKAVVELTLDSSLVSTIALTPERVLIYNDVAARLYGGRHPAALGRPLRETFPDSYPAVEPLYDRVFAGESAEVRGQPLAVGTGEGLEVFDAYLVPIRAADGAIIGAQMTGLEVGDRTRAEIALRDSEARLAAAFESVPVGAAAIDTAGVAVLSNAEYRRFLPSGVVPSHDLARVDRWRAWDREGRPLEARHFPAARALRGESVVPGQEMLYTTEEGREVWTSVATAPTRDEQGRVTGAVAVIADIDIAKRSREALRASEERFRQFGEASQDVLWIRDAETFQWEYLTPAFEVIYGLDREAALRGDNMAGWLELGLPEDGDHAVSTLQRVRRGEKVTFEYRVRRPVDGQIRWLRNTDFPIQDASGKVVRIGGVGHDVTELKRAEAIVADSETRLRTLMEGIPQLVWRSCDQGLWTWASPQWLAFTGQAQEESHGRGWLDVIHPDDHAATLRAWEETRPPGMLDVENRVRRVADGAWVWHHTRSVPVRGADGSIVEWLGTSTDIQNLRELQERQQVLVTELQHRTFNLLGVVRSTADVSLRSSESLDDFKWSFRDRLDSLARAQRLLSRLGEDNRVTFDELIRSELTSVGAFQHGDGRVTMEGPEGVALRSSTVQTFAMAIHELATNALKYGALKQEGARLAVRWRVEASETDEPWLHVDWAESGVAMQPPGATPTGTGQGRILIEEALPYQLQARTSYVMAADGVHCSISLPVSRRGDPGKASAIA